MSNPLIIGIPSKGRLQEKNPGIIRRCRDES